MRQNEVFPKYRNDVKEMNRLYLYLKENFIDTYVDELCSYRGYVSDENNPSSQRKLIQEMELGYVDIEDIDYLKGFQEDFGLITKNENFILNNRFLIPVYDLSGELITLIGYFPDVKKYITLPTSYFSKEILYLNMRHAYDLSWKEYDGFVILVEGVFDCLSLRSIGLPAIATMGSTVSKTKGELLKLFKKVLAIPDDDKVGRRALNRYSKYGWKVPDNTTFLKFDGGYVDFNGNKQHCKDMDNFVSWYEAEDVKEILLSYRDSREEIEELIL